MKSWKLIALISALMLCFTMSAVADTTIGQLDGHDLTMILPDGYSASPCEGDWVNHYNIDSPQTDTPNYRMGFAFMEEYSGVSSYDMEEADFQQLAELLQEAYNKPTVSFSQTQEGSRLIIIDENDSESDYANIYTLYKGYFVQVYISRPDYAELSQSDIDMGIQLINDTHIIGL